MPAAWSLLDREWGVDHELDVPVRYGAAAAIVPFCVEMIDAALPVVGCELAG